MPLTASDFEGDDSKITGMTFEFWDHADEGEIQLLYTNENDQTAVIDWIFVSDRSTLEQIGQAIGRSTVLRELMFWLDPNADNIPREWANNIEAFFNGLKQNTSLEHLEFYNVPKIGVQCLISSTSWLTTNS